MDSSYEKVECKFCQRKFAYIMKHLVQANDCMAAYTEEEIFVLRQESKRITDVERKKRQRNCDCVDIARAAAGQLVMTPVTRVTGSGDCWPGTGLDLDTGPCSDGGHGASKRRLRSVQQLPPVGSSNWLSLFPGHV